MSESKKPVTVNFAPGCFDDFEGTQEELEAFMQEITDIFQDPEKLSEMAELVDLDEVEDEVLDKIAQAIDPELPSDRVLH